MNRIFVCLFMVMLCCSPVFAAKKGTGKSHEPDPFIVILCSGKSGSSTLASSFERLDFKVWHGHSIESRGLLHKILAKQQENAYVVMIDSIRDILARKISSFFQNLNEHMHMENHEIARKYRKEGVGFLLEGFHQIIFEIEQYYSFYQWEPLGYNCLEEGTFDFENKYQLKQLGNTYFINLRFDDIKHWESIIKSIDLPIDLNKFKIISDNKSKNKWYSSIHHDFMKHFTLSQPEFDRIYAKNLREMQHFYTPEEIQKFVDRWKPYIR
jgi:hypothetical protein